MTAPLIDTQDAAAAAIDQLVEPVALDTEFHSEHRFHPRPMLLQVRGVGGPTHLIDLRRVELGELHALSGRRLIAHAPAQDLRILRRAGLEPGPVTCTQVLAGFAGLGFPRALGDLVAEVLGRDPGRAQTLSDWSKRPLTARQLAYAAADVEPLHELADALRARTPTEFLPAVDEATRETLTSPPHARAWERIRASSVLDPAALTTLKRLAAWRQARAERDDHPVHQVGSDAALIDLARRRPRSVAEMLENRRFPKRLARTHGDELLPLLDVADAGRWDHAAQARRDAARLAFQAWAARRGLEIGVAPRLLLPDATIAAVLDGLIAGEDPRDRLEGWRIAAAGDELSRFVTDSNILELLTSS